jgi:hypothetical protein
MSGSASCQTTANPVRLRQFGIERVDFLGADVSREERVGVGGEAAPLSNHVAKGQGHALQREKRFRPGRANLDATKRWVGPALVEVKILAVPRPCGKTDDGVLPIGCDHF